MTILRAIVDTPSILDRIDPRVRVLCLAVGSLWAAAMTRPLPLLVAVGLALLLAVLVRVPWSVLLGRLVPLNGFMVIVLATLPFSTPGDPWISIGAGPGAWIATTQGIEHAVRIALSGNLLVILMTALIASLEPAVLAQALVGLRLPEKLVRILMFAIRYVDVLQATRVRIGRAMRARGHVRGFDAHTWRSTAHVVVALLGHSVERAQRIEQAMRCRGWRGRFPPGSRFRPTARDGLFVSLFVVVLGCLTILF
ncbi:MAG: cobalt ECF transporter T component CbiQ [Burkholderiales bacterium]|nr:cobalt ECF transporter T component CbiQ [Burkholderiales bacterium]